VRYCIKLVEFELVIRADVDVCPLILGAIAVFWGRKY
jgi:hypothetical protein